MPGGLFSLTGWLPRHVNPWRRLFGGDRRFLFAGRSRKVEHRAAVLMQGAQPAALLDFLHGLRVTYKPVGVVAVIRIPGDIASSLRGCSLGACTAAPELAG